MRAGEFELASVQCRLGGNAVLLVKYLIGRLASSQSKYRDQG
jgi:hypothetical protein